MFASQAVPVDEDPPDEVLVAPPPREWSAEAANGLLALDLDWAALEHGAFEQLERIGAWEKIIGYAQAMQACEIASFYDRAQSRPGVHAEQADRSACAEVAMMLRIADQTAGSRIHDAQTLTGRLPQVWAALHAGRITLPKARILAEQTVQLSPERAQRVADRVLPRAETQTPGQLRASVRRAVARADADALIRRASAERRRRGVWLREEPDGMATLEAYLPAPEAVGAYAVLDECARAAAGDHEDRTMDERRADALVDLVLDGVHADCAGDCTPQPPTPADGTVEPGTRPVTWGPASFVSAGTTRARANPPHLRGGRRGPRVSVQVRVTVPYTTLLGLDHAPGELAGYGPLPADTARELAGQGTWRRLLTDPKSGALLDYGTTTYRPPAHLTEHVTARDQTCRRPGCRQPAHRCDLDHTVPFPHGPTAAHNLGPKCRHDHNLKATPGWSVTQHDDGTVTWTTPSGHIYRVQPPPLPQPDTPRTDPGEDPPF